MQVKVASPPTSGKLYPPPFINLSTVAHSLFLSSTSAQQQSTVVTKALSAIVFFLDIAAATVIPPRADVSNAALAVIKTDDSRTVGEGVSESIKLLVWIAATNDPQPAPATRT